MRGDEWRRRVYFHHTGYPGGASWTVAWELHKKDPTLVPIFFPIRIPSPLLQPSEFYALYVQVLRKAVYTQLAKNLLRKGHMERLHIFPDSEIPEDIRANICGQIRPLRPVPKRLQEYTEEEINSYPKVFDYPHDYIVRQFASQNTCSLTRPIKTSKGDIQ